MQKIKTHPAANQTMVARRIIISTARQQSLTEIHHLQKVVDHRTAALVQALRAARLTRLVVLMEVAAAVSQAIAAVLLAIIIATVQAANLARTLVHHLRLRSQAILLLLEVHRRLMVRLLAISTMRQLLLTETLRLLKSTVVQVLLASQTMVAQLLVTMTTTIISRRQSRL